MAKTPVHAAAAESDWDAQSHYSPSQIRTPNMLPDRSADVHLDPERAEKLPDGTIHYPDASQTRQAFAQECDINYILKNNALVAPLTPEQYSRLNFQDLGTSIDFHAAKNYLFEAERSFMSLPAAIRSRFENNPGHFLDFVQNPANAEELIAMGLATAPQIVPDVGATPAPAKNKKPAPAASDESQE